jgi:integrase
MGQTGRKYTGVKARENAIQIYFRLKGEDRYCYETLPWAPTPANLAKAEKLRKEITDRIKHDVFVYADYFPDSARAQITNGTFFDFAQAWLNDPTNDWTPQSRYKFKGILQRVWMPFLDTRNIRHVTPATLTEALAGAIVQFKFKNGGKEPSKSLFNDWLLCARGVFAMASKAGAIKPLEDPTQHLKNKTREQSDIDPFDISEANAIIAAMYEHYGDQWGAYFELGFYSGMRYPSEPSALTWLDVDLNTGEIKVNKSHTRLGLQNRTKTNKSRILYLNSRSRAALERLYPITQGHPTIFVNSQGGDTYNAKLQRTIWKEVLTKLGVRYRDMYNMRHTYATFGLMNGVNPAFMAEQLGHSIQEFFKTYAKWINSSQNRVQLSLIERAIRS